MYWCTVVVAQEVSASVAAEADVGRYPAFVVTEGIAASLFPCVVLLAAADEEITKGADDFFGLG